MRLYQKTGDWLLCLCLSFLSYYTTAQSLDQPIPFDPEVRTGTLSNGLRYYIRKNSQPEKKVELRLVVNAGAIEEDKHQQGLAHFVEHMAFNGSKNFKKNELVDYLQLMGVQFVAHINAYTNHDETVYRLSLPVNKKGILDKGLLILEDWAHQLSFDHEEIDKERQVVVEEWRMNKGVQQRWKKKYLPLFFNHSKYAQRTVIGNEKILQTFEYKSLKKFYKDWYRPDLMAVVVVGDIDVASMEQKIKSRFSAIKPATNARPKKRCMIGAHKEPLIAIYADKEIPFASVELSYQQPFQPVTTLKKYRQHLVKQLAFAMFNQRLEELAKQANVPFNDATFSMAHPVNPLATYEASIRARGGQVLEALQAFLLEKKRIEQHGFTKEELAQHKKVIESNVNLARQQRSNKLSADYAQEYIDHFLDGTPSISIQFMHQFVNQQLSTIELEDIHRFVKNWTNNHSLVAGVTLPKNKEQNRVTKQEVLNVWNIVAQIKVTPYKSSVTNASQVLLDEKDLPKAGKIVSSHTHKKQNITTLSLSNGVKVILKPTKFAKNQIIFKGYSQGGYSVLDVRDQLAALCAPDVIIKNGVGRFSFQQLKQMLSTKSVSFAPYISELSEGFEGGASSQDLETLLKLTHLYCTQPRQDSVAFRLWLEEQKNIAQNMVNNPFASYQEVINYTLAQGHPRREKSIWSVEDFDKINLAQIMRVYKDRFADPNNFTFVFVGDFDLGHMKGLLEKYLGSLPVKQRSESFKDLGIRPPVGLTKKEVYKGAASRSIVTVGFVGQTSYSEKKAELMRFLAQILKLRFEEKLREEKGLIYSLDVFAELDKVPYQRYKIGLVFPCAPQNTQQVHNVVLEEIKQMQKKGIASKYLTKAKEAINQEKETALKNNAYWLSILSAHSHHKNFENLLGVANHNITSEDVQKLMKKLMDTKQYVHLVLYPEGYKK